MDAILLVPAFPSAGRTTEGGIHYAMVGGRRTPVGESEFARDTTFGFTSSSLSDWVQEKTEGAVGPDEIVHIGLDQLRSCDLDNLLEIATDHRHVTCDIVTDEDLVRLARATRSARRRGQRIISVSYTHLTLPTTPYV